jgi:hypothetical protein
MEILVEYALKKLNSYFEKEQYNSGLTFIRTRTEVDNLIILRTGSGEEIFCPRLGNCLIMTDSSEDAERINRLWCYDKCVDPNSSDERLPELGCN